MSFKIINTKIFCTGTLLNSTLESVVTNEMHELVGRNNQEHCVGSCNHHHWAAVVSCSWVKVSACHLKVSVFRPCPLPDHITMT